MPPFLAGAELPGHAFYRMVPHSTIEQKIVREAPIAYSTMPKGKSIARIRAWPALYSMLQYFYTHYAIGIQIRRFTRSHTTGAPAGDGIRFPGRDRATRVLAEQPLPLHSAMLLPTWVWHTRIDIVLQQKGGRGFPTADQTAWLLLRNDDEDSYHRSTGQRRHRNCQAVTRTGRAVSRRRTEC